MVTNFGLREQPIFPHFSHPLFARLFMLRPMILLTVNAAVFYKMAGALFEFDIIHFRFATGSTAHHHVVCLPLFAMNRCTHNYLTNNIIIRPSSVGTTNNNKNTMMFS
jgi:hypothetical protein